jgi:nuclear pore complex protein Nup107
MIVDTFPYNEVSLRKSYETIGRAINVMNTKAEPQDQEEAMKREVMQRQSNTYYELSRLVDAIEALAVWRNEEQKYITRVTKPPNVPDRLKDAFKAVKEAMAPILRGILQRSVDLGEEEDLAFIRNHYIPEIVVAYNTVLHAAGNLITRDYLLESMQLSVTIADGTRNGESNGLQEAFVKAGRMRELVESFALTSKVMLILKAEGKPWKQGKDSKGADLGVWEIGGRGGGEE